MFLRKLFVFFMMLLVIPAVFSFSTCSFTNQESDVCLKSYSGVNSIQLENNEKSLVDIPSVSLFLEDKKFVGVQQKLSNKEIGSYQFNTFNKAGIYTLTASGYTKTTELFTDSSASVVVDLYQPNAPAIPLTFSTSFSLMLEDENDVLHIEDINGNSLGTIIDDQTNSKKKTIDLSSVPVNTLIVFYITSQNGIPSSKVYRFYQGKDVNVDVSLEVSSVTLDSTLMDVVNKKYSNTVYSKYYFVSGSTSQSSGAVRIQGKLFPIVKGKFGGFVYLHPGTNTIEISSVSGKVITTHSIVYDDTRLYLTSYSLQSKVVSSSTASVSLSLSRPSDYLIFVNGNVISQGRVNLGETTLEFTDLVPGRNEISILLESGLRMDETVYYDVETPQISQVSFEEISQNGQLVFEIQDDLGVLPSSLSISIDGEDISSYSLISNYLVISIKKIDLLFGEHSITISGRDYVGNDFRYSGSFSVSNSSLVTFERHPDYFVLGNTIYVFTSNVEFSFSSPQPLAFKHILLDSFEVVSYEFETGTSGKIFVDFSGKSQGNFTLEFIDAENTVHTQKYSYVVFPSSSPSLFLEDVSFPNVEVDGVLYHKVQGYFNDETFNFINPYSLTISGQDALIFGNYFEVFVDASKDFDVSLEYLSGEMFSPLGVSSPFSTIDDTSLIVSPTSFGNVIQVENSEYLHELISYNGNSYIYTPVLNPSSLSTHVTGFLVSDIVFKQKDSSHLQSYNTVVSSGNLPPFAFIYEEDSSRYLIVSDREDEISSIIFSVNSSLGCSYSFGLYSKCRDITGFENQLITITDVENNSISLNLNDLGVVSSLDLVTEGSVYVSSLFENGNTIYVDGSFVVPGVVSNVQLNGFSCSFDSETFACISSKGNGNASLVVSYLVDDVPGEISKEISFESTSEVSEVDLTNLTNTILAENLYYYFGDGDVTAEFSLGSDAAVSLYLEGERVDITSFSAGNHSKQLPLELYLGNKDKKEIEVQLVAENDAGTSVSNILTIAYYKVKEFLFTISIF
jgi:hypothetical protein